MQHRLPVSQPQTLRDPAVCAELVALAPDVMVVVAYGQILPPAVLQLPRLGCLNIHASLLPRWRGAAPIQRAILAGDAVTGVTLMQMDAGLDTGAMLAVRAVPIGERATSAVAAWGTREPRRAVPARSPGRRWPPEMRRRRSRNLRPGSAMRRRSPSRRRTSTGAPRPPPSLARCAPSIPGRSPKRRSAASSCGFMTLTRRRARDAAEAAPGTWLGLAGGDGGEVLRVACGSGELHVTQLQRAGRKVVAAREFLNSAGATAGRFG